MRIALIGATGLVGSRLVPLLAGKDLLLLTRRPTGFEGMAQRVGPAEQWPAMLGNEALDAAVCALGTTWRKSGSWEMFEQVDRQLVVDFARAAIAAGAKRMICVTSVGADAHSKARYLALKGRLEEDLSSLGFQRLDLLRPGLLRGPRGSDRRLKERLAIALSPLTNLVLGGPQNRFAAIDAGQVAKAMAALLDQPGNGVFIHENREIRHLASS